MKHGRLFARLLCAVIVFTMIYPPLPTRAATKMSLEYAVHIQNLGDSQGFVREGEMAGTSGLSYRLEAIRLRLTGDEYSGHVVYKTHVQNEGWQDWRQDGQESGSRGLGRRLEGIEIYLTGEVAEHYDIEYRVHCQTYGWMNWARNGEMAGTSGQSKRLEGIEIRLVPKSQLTDMGVTYRTHCQTYGWLPWTANGVGNGTSGESKRLESIEIKLTGNRYSGGISYRTHVQTYGWETAWLSNGALSGTTGESKRLEAIQISLYGDVAQYYDVYYRVHAQTYGWMGWAKNGETAGTSGGSKRLEMIEICLVRKPGDGSDNTPAVPVGEDNGNQQAYIDVKSTPEPTPEPTPAKSSEFDDRAQAVLDLCNYYRSENGVNKSLKLNKKLCEAAQIRAEEIKELFSHTRPDGRSCGTVLDEVGYDWMTRGENIAYSMAGGYGSDYYGKCTTPEGVMDGWMNSPGHRANILNGSFEELGVGCFTVTQNGQNYIYWVQVFGTQ